MTDEFSRAVRSTASTLRVDGRELSPAQIEALIAFLRREGVEADATETLGANRPKLANGSVYVLYSGTGQEDAAAKYIGEVGKTKAEIFRGQYT